MFFFLSFFRRANSILREPLMVVYGWQKDGAIGMMQKFKQLYSCLLLGSAKADPYANFNRPNSIVLHYCQYQIVIFSATEHGYMYHVTSRVLRYARFYDINK